MKKILFIGVGKMSTAIIKAINNNSEYKIYGYSKNIEKLKLNAKELNIEVYENIENIEEFDVIFLGVKPNNLEEISSLIKLNDKQILVSMLSGIELKKLNDNFTKTYNIVRIMPNINAAVQKSVTGYISNNKNNLELIVDLLNKCGTTYEIEEKLFSEFTIAAGCLPAYAFLFFKGFIDAAIKTGLNKEESKKIILDTIMGSIINVYHNEDDLETLIESVCSPGGVTIEGIKSFKENNFEKIIEIAFNAALKKDKDR